MKILIATHNPAKFERYYRLLADYNQIEWFSLDDLGIDTKVEEPFKTAKENSLHKAREYAKLTHMSVLASDEAASTNFLPHDMQPGVYVRRLNGGKEATDEEILEFWQQTFKKFPQPNKKFFWTYYLSFYNKETDQLNSVKATLQSTVTENFSTKCIPGYPMSSFQIPEGMIKPHSELTLEEKLEVDRVGFKEFLEEFPRWIGKD